MSKDLKFELSSEMVEELQTYSEILKKDVNNILIPIPIKNQNSKRLYCDIV